MMRNQASNQKNNLEPCQIQAQNDHGAQRQAA
jgi:hypothetical protein